MQYTLRFTAVTSRRFQLDLLPVHYHGEGPITPCRHVAVVRRVKCKGIEHAQVQTLRDHGGRERGVTFYDVLKPGGPGFPVREVDAVDDIVQQLQSRPQTCR